MKTSDRFNNAVSKLVRAFFDGTLKKSHCGACAIGNICNGKYEWASVFSTTREGGQEINYRFYHGIAKRVIDKTGYTVEELARVEKAFETNTFIVYEEYPFEDSKKVMEDQYNGLMAVIDVLCDIEGYSEEKLSETKDLFNYET